MEIPTTSQIETDFPYLKNAPIVEAVVDFRAAATTPWDADGLAKALKGRLPDFPSIKPQRRQLQEFRAEVGQPPKAFVKDLGVLGFVLTSKDQRRIAQFDSQGASYSRLKPYPKWTVFAKEAVDIWRLYRDLRKPTEVARIGVRYINRIDLPSDDCNLGAYFRDPPMSPVGFPIPFANFMYQALFAVPDTPYSIRLIRTIQPSAPPSIRRPGLIIDLDVFTTRPLPADKGTMERRLAEMRWLKNKVFFATITDEAENQFK